MLGRNTIWNLIGQAAPAFAALFTVPILVHALGPERFGILTLIWLVVGYFSVFDLGLGRALTQALAERLGAGDEDAISPLVWTALGLMGALGLAGAAIAVVTAPLLEQALKTPASLADETLRALYWLALSIPIVVSTAGLRGVLEARQRFDLANTVRLASGVATYVAPVLVLGMSRSLVAITVVLVAARFLTWIAYLVMCVHEVPQLAHRARFARAYVRPLLRMGGWMTVSNLVSPILVYLDRFLIATVIGAAAVAYYVTPFEIITRFLLLPWAVAGVLFPLIASTFTRAPEESARVYSRGLRLIFVSLFPFVLLATAFAHEGLALWVGESIASQSATVLRWLALGVLLNGVVQVPFATIQAAARPDLTARIHLIELPIYVPVLWLFARRWGIEGAAAAWTFRAALDFVIQVIIAARLLPVPPQRNVRRSAVRAAAATVLAALGLGAAAWIPSIPLRAAAMFLTLAVFAAVSWTLLLDPQERAYFRSFVSRATTRLRPA